MQHANIHTHTTFSDGKNTPEEMVQRAVELGFSSIGISDHSETAFESYYCMATSEYDRYRRTLRELKERYEGQIDVLLGIEQDSYSPAICDGFDYVIGSVHYVLCGSDYSNVDKTLEIQMRAIENYFGGDKTEYAKRYFELVAENAIRGGFEVVGHFDLLNKFGLFSDCTETYEKIALEALDTCLSRIPYIEMNTGAIARGYKTVYPDFFLLHRILQKGGKLVLNGDSHSAEALDCHFDASVTALKEIGFTSLWQLRKSGWTEVLI